MKSNKISLVSMFFAGTILFFVQYVYSISYNQNIQECLFSHGIADTYKQAQKYVKFFYRNNKKYNNIFYTIEVPTYAFNYPDATDHIWRVNFWYTSFGQHNEIAALKKAFEQRKQFHKKNHNRVTFILYGLSRGASTIINFLSSFPEAAEHIDALILESPFDQIVSVAHAFAIQLSNNNMFYLMPYLYKNAVLYEHITTSFIHAFMGALFMQYDKQSITPLQSISTLPKHIPILIICSIEDILVPWHSSFKIYTTLRASGYQNAHILILNRGAHAHLLSEHYHTVVHAFYQKYNLPHNTKAAEHGKKLLLFCQP